MGKNHLVTFVDSIITVVTKCRPQNKLENYDTDYTGQDISNHLYQYFGLNEQSESRSDEQREMNDDEVEMNDDEKFIDLFAFRTILYDPIDRPIINQ